MNTEPPINRMRRRFKLLGILVAFFGAWWCYAYAYNHTSFKRLDNEYSPRFGYAVDAREKEFAREFPSKKEIETYLSDATILISHPSVGNAAFYFDNHQNFMQWHDRSVVAGSWRIRAELKIMTLNGQWRIAIVQIFCTWFSDMDAVAQQDNCRELGGFDSVFTQGRGTNREYRKGNIFSLRVDEQSVEQLSKTEITIESVLAMKGRRAD